MHLRRKKRPTKLDGGGSGIYCCIPGCKSVMYDRDGNLKNPIPDNLQSDRDTNRKWRNVVKQFRRCGAGNKLNFSIFYLWK